VRDGMGETAMLRLTPLASIWTSAPLLLVAFAAALLVALAASAWFTRTLESLCDRLGLSIGLLNVWCEIP
jgi:Zn-dependent protease with chaperone function